jgi:hypothetical protein
MPWTIDENVHLFILCTQFVNVSSIFNKQTALLREGCPFVLMALALCHGIKGLPQPELATIGRS